MNQLELIVQIGPPTLIIEQRADRWAGRLDLGFTQKDDDGASGLIGSLTVP